MAYRYRPVVNIHNDYIDFRKTGHAGCTRIAWRPAIKAGRHGCAQPRYRQLVVTWFFLLMLAWLTSPAAKPLNTRSEGTSTLVDAGSQPHPRLYITPADIQLLKYRIKQPAYRKTWQWVLGAARNYTATGNPYLTSHGDMQAIRLPEEEVLLRAIELLPHNALAFLVTGEEQYLKTAIHWLDTLADRDDWFSDNDMTTAYIIFYCVMTYDWLYDNLDSYRRARYRKVIAGHAQRLWNLLHKKEGGWSNNLLSNHNYIPAMAIGVTGIALTGEVAGADQWVESAAENFSNVLRYLSPDGASHEGVGYWSTGTAGMLMYFLAVEPYLGIDELRDSEFFRNTANYRLYMSLPGYIENADYGDSPRQDLWGPGYILHALARIFGDRHAQWLGDTIQTARGKPGRGGFFDLLWRDDEIHSQPPTDLPTSKLFDNLGLFVTRDAWDQGSFWSLFKAGPPQGWHAFNMGYFTGSHIHPDSGNYSLWKDGKWLVLDEGYVRKKWTRNHNVYLFNDTGQSGEGHAAFRATKSGHHQANARIVYSKIQEDYQYLVADLTESYQPDAGLEFWERTFIVLGGNGVIVRDRIHLQREGYVQGMIYVPQTAHIMGAHSVCLDAHSGNTMIASLPKGWSMRANPSSIPEQERHKHGNYDRLQIQQSGHTTHETEIINYFYSQESGCKRDKIPTLDTIGNTLSITQGSTRFSIDFANRSVQPANKTN